MSQKIRRGFTILEVTIAMGIFALLAGSIMEVYIKSGQTSRVLTNQLSGEAQVRTLVQNFVSEVRSAQYSNVGTFPVLKATNNEVNFFSNVDSDAAIEQIRYFLVGNILKKGVIKPDSNEQYLPSNEVVTNVLNNVTTTAAIFSYYPTDNASSTLVQPVNLSQVRLVGINLNISTNPQVKISSFSTQTKAQIRSLENVPVSYGLVHVSDILINPSVLSLSTYATYTFVASIIPSNALNKTVTWSVLTSSGGTIDPFGNYVAPSSPINPIIIQAVADDGGFVATSSVSCTASTCTSFTYSGWGSCQADSTQSRSVTSQSPAGCIGGSPVTSQSCTPTCTSWTYSSWGSCQADSTQTRSITSQSPAGCSGGSPVTSQSCTPTCTSFSYSSWGSCQADSTQTRSVTSQSPAGCSGGSPVTSQSCTPTCTSFSYSSWGSCQANSTQTRSITSQSPAGCSGGSPVTSQSCTPTCTSFSYSSWGSCQADSTQTRSVTSQSPAGCSGGSPVTSQSCTPTCTSWTYGAWSPSSCPPSQVQTRSIASASPAGCSGGSPVTTQVCVYVLPTCTYAVGAWGLCLNGTQTRTVTNDNAPCSGGSVPASSQWCAWYETGCGVQLYYTDSGLSNHGNAITFCAGMGGKLATAAQMQCIWYTRFSYSTSLFATNDTAMPWNFYWLDGTIGYMDGLHGYNYNFKEGYSSNSGVTGLEHVRCVR